MQFRQTVINTVANVKKLYYDVIFNIDNLAGRAEEPRPSHRSC